MELCSLPSTDPTRIRRFRPRGDSPLLTLDARGREVPGSGGAATKWSSEDRQRRANTAAASAHGSSESGASKASRYAIFGEEVEGETAKLPMCTDLRGEEQSGVAVCRRRRRLARRGRRRRGEEEAMSLLQKRPGSFRKLRFGPSSLRNMECGAFFSSCLSFSVKWRGNVWLTCGAHPCTVQHCSLL